MLGPPGAGKGTQAERLSRTRRLPKISTGDILREAVQSGTDVGRAARQTMEAGNLVGDDIMIAIVQDRLNRADARCGFVLDGFPRTTAQADGLAALLGAKRIDRVVNLVVPAETVVRRLQDRWLCPGCGAIYNMATLPPKAEGVCDVCGTRLVQRADDRPETVRARLEVYERETAPLVVYYERLGALRNVDASGSPDQVYEAVQRALGKVAA